MQVYLDNAASTMVDPEILDLMSEVSREFYANPASVHLMGQGANAMLEKAREKAALLLGVLPKNIIFTSSASEANAMILTFPHKSISVLSTDHSSVIEAVHEHEIEVDENGILRRESLKRAIELGTDLISISHVNSETGVIQPIEVIREYYGGLLHSDSSQSVGKVDSILEYVDSMTISPHKFHGPKGVGILVVKDRAKLRKMIFGGTRERGRRGGTENLAGISGAVLALERAIKGIGEMRRIAELRDYFEERLKSSFKVRINGLNRAPHISSVSFYDMDESTILALDMKGIYASSGSACSSGSLDVSHVLKSMGLDDRLNKSSIRFSFSKYNTRDEVDYVIKSLMEIKN